MKVDGVKVASSNDFDSKTKTILERAAYNCPVHHSISENVDKSITFSYLKSID